MNDSTSARMIPSAQTTVGAVVADDFRTARVFEAHGIDFCCGGKVALGAICREQGLDLGELLREIAGAKSAAVGSSQNYAAWALPFLADYIVNTHHVYLNENTGQIAAYASKIAQVHGAHHPEVIEIAAIFAKIATDMAAHLREEEEVLFPAIKRIDASTRAGHAPEAADVATIQASLVKLDQEHQEIGDAVHAIRDLAKGYGVPEGVCNTFAVTYQKLREFEDDLHKHVHLENNILFPKAARLGCADKRCPPSGPARRRP
ncbi:iron-sulfur cluster repair di-iron protein [Desulfuromonas versatilis]|uniref:Iron-sulfur cluster repair di-iron protein n=1 Tax=Desulfuromonas versatilis TaxID=2802975 RepID=A0ABM8HV67_9BACT|nr:iron-sulfur cluster repair di-iron protein [Desulfuromonas versatilis]BCR06200.1 iron-sulfur cluster repair di-iron protein [Desulfuromonas versatilis]